MYILGNIHAYIFRIAFGTILCCVNCIVLLVHRPTSSLRCAVSAANAVNVFDFGDGTRVRSCVVCGCPLFSFVYTHVQVGKISTSSVGHLRDVERSYLWAYAHG